MKFEFLDHTADAKFIAYGKNLEGAFTNAALALFTLITDVEKVQPKIKKIIKVKAKKKRSLLFDFLEEFIFLIDTEGFLLSKINKLTIKENDGFELEAEVLGDVGEYEIITQVKAMTYSDMFIKEEKDRVSVQVVPDL